MPLLALPFNYLWWHYTLAWRDLWGIFSNFIWFLYHFFSLPVLVRTLFSPWKRLGEVYPDHFDLGATLATFFINSLMRFVGLLFRVVLICFGSLVLVVTCVLAVIMFAIWLALPGIIGYAFISGFYLLFS